MTPERTPPAARRKTRPILAAVAALGVAVALSACEPIPPTIPTPPTTPPPTTTTTTTAPGAVPRLLLGLGAEANSAGADSLVTSAAPGTGVRMLTSWYNGPNDLNWMKYWTGPTHTIGKAYAAGDALHLIVYSNDSSSSTISTKYGNACGRAYPLSAGFLNDMDTLARTFAGTATSPPLYVTMFTEFQTYPCVSNAWAATPAVTHYYQALKDQYLAALAIFHRDAPNAKVSLGWGGWQSRFDDPAIGGGRSMLSHIADVMAASDFQSFQAMQSDSNLNDIVSMTTILGAYGKVMLAHYKPNGGSQATFDADVATIFTDAYLRKVTKLGLFAFSFMDPTNEQAEASTHTALVAAANRYGAMP